MAEFSASTSVLSHCNLRPAASSDRRQIRLLTRRLHQTATPASPWQTFTAWLVVGCLLALFWHYPTLGVTLLVSSTPLLAIVLLAIVMADREQQQQFERYWVMEVNGHLVGCGRVDIHEKHSEIYDLFVADEWRSCGIGRAIMQQLVIQATSPIYLASLPKAISFYQQLGFQAITAKELPILLAGRLSLNSPRYRQVGLQPMVLKK